MEEVAVSPKLHCQLVISLPGTVTVWSMNDITECWHTLSGIVNWARRHELLSAGTQAAYCEVFPVVSVTVAVMVPLKAPLKTYTPLDAAVTVPIKVFPSQKVQLSS